MSLKDDLISFAGRTHRAGWGTVDGRVVPDTEDIGLGNRAIKLDATVLYADLAQSTELVASHADFFAAEVYKNYLYAASRLIRNRGGSVTAFDGDRVMGVFIGEDQHTLAVRCALNISSVTQTILQPALEAVYGESYYVYKQKVGVDSSPLFVARTGIRGSNDLVWVGEAANNAAKMAALSSDYSSYISAEVYSKMSDSARYGGGEDQNMWTPLGDVLKSGYDIYGSRWRWNIG